MSESHKPHPYTKVPEHDIMSSVYNELPKVTDTDIEMLLYAWFTKFYQI